MDRNKSTSNSRGAKSKITQYPPDIFALGSKQPSTRDVDPKRTSTQHKSSSSSKSSSKSSHAPPIPLSSDRKRDHSANLAPVPPSKKPKVGGPVIRAVNVSASGSGGSGGSAVASGSTGSSERSMSVNPTVEYWETIAIECEPYDLVRNIVSSYENNEHDKVLAYVTGAVKSLRAQRYKPCKVLFYSLCYLAKLRPSLFASEHVTAALASILRRSAGDTAAHSIKSKGNPAVPVLCVNLLLRAYGPDRNWPELFVRLYVEDALGDRIWVDHEECKCFVDNIITAFTTRVPPKSLLTPELSGALSGPRESTSSPVPLITSAIATAGADDDGLREGGRSTPDIPPDGGAHRENVDVPILPRYLQSAEIVEQIVLEAIKDQLNRRQAPETITRNFLRLLSSACGLVEIRMIAVCRLEMWLHSPKLMRPAQELLAYLCCNCASGTQRDLEVLAHLTKIRLKTKALVNVYLNCLREVVTMSGGNGNLSPILKHTIYNELSNARNPNNMAMVAVMFQAAAETAAQVLAEIFQDLLMNKDDYLRSLRALLREIVRVLRFDVDLHALCRALVRERPELGATLRDLEHRDRVFLATADLLTVCMFLSVSPQVKEAAQLLARGDKKDVAVLQAHQLTVAKIQREAVTWLHENVLRLYRPQMQDYAHVLHKIFFLEPVDQYYKLDNWPNESDRNLLYRLTSEVPLLQATFIRILLIGISKEHPLNPGDALELSDQLIKRAATLPNDTLPPLQADKLEIIDFIFNLAAYHHPENMTLPPGYSPPQLAISNLYWKSWIMLLILSAHNPATFGNLAWKKYPMLRTFMEMCITNHFSYPPPTVAMGEMFEELKNKELQISALEKQEILEFESHLAAVSTKMTITEQNSLLISQLMEMKPTGDARQPPQLILDQLHSLNTTHRMGHLLCRSRHPDFLLDIIQRQGSSQHMPWLADLVHNSEGALSHLPVQCLCEYLLISGSSTASASATGTSPDRHKKHAQVLAHLQTVLTDRNEEVNAVYEILEYFLRRLTCVHCASRVQAIKGLKMILSAPTGAAAPIEDDNNTDDETLMGLGSGGERDHAKDWLMRQLPLLPHYPAVRHLVGSSLRQACQVETDPENISAYINFLAQQQQQSLQQPPPHDEDDDPLSDWSDLVLDLAQLIVERATLTTAVLPIPDIENKTSALTTLHSLMIMFCSYLKRIKDEVHPRPRLRPRPEAEIYQWTGETHEQILITWQNGDECTIHILVVHAMIILLTYGPTVGSKSEELFEMLLETWFPKKGDPPKVYLVDTSEEAILIPDWLKLRMIRSSVPRLVDAALVHLEPSQLVLFIQSFGIPVPSMSKLLQMLDAAVTVDQHSVGEAVLDKCYMAQLVQVQHRRGATGGNTFVQVLQLQEPKLPDEIIIETGTTRQKFPKNVTNFDRRQNTDTNSIIMLLNAIFLKSNYENDIDKDFRNLLQNLAQEIHTKSPKNTTIIKTVIEYFISSVQSKNFINCLLLNESYASTILRLILSNSNIPNYTSGDMFNLSKTILANIPDKKSSLAGILNQFHRKQQKTAIKQLNTNKSGQHTFDILNNTDSVSLERTTKCLVEKYLEVGTSGLMLLDSLSKLLMTDVDNNYFDRTGLFIDWIAELEIEMIGSSPTLQMELLFSKNRANMAAKCQQMSFRPYLLTLLAHRVSWRALYNCVDRILLIESTDKYNPEDILDFLWALTCNPKLWQGRDKFTPKNYRPENVLQLTNSQILVLVNYILAEAIQFSNRSLKKIEDRLPLLLQSLNNQNDVIINIVRHLVTIIQMKEPPSEKLDIQVINLDDSNNEDRRKSKSEVAEEFLILLYMKIPRIIELIPLRDQKQMNMSKITEFSTSIIDKITHSLFTALASTPRSKDWLRKSQEFELLARKMAAIHPSLVLRQLPMIAASLKGRTHLDFSVFKSRNHLNLFSQILGIVDLMQPNIFSGEYQEGLEGVLMAYFSLFKYHGHVKELQTILGKFVNFLQSYISFDASRALKYIQKHAHLLNDLHLNYSNVRALRILMSSISLPKEENPLIETAEDGGEVLVAVARAPSPEPLPANWNHLVLCLSKLQDDELPNILQEIDHLSNRRPAILETISCLLCPLILSPFSTVRQLGHVLLLRHLKHRPSADNGGAPVLTVVLQALDSNNSDIVNGVLEKLSEYVVCLQEHAVYILEKSFNLGVKSNINTTGNIAKAISVLNIQSCSK